LIELTELAEHFKNDQKLLDERIGKLKENAELM
jgi:hypothetical protein